MRALSISLSSFRWMNCQEFTFTLTKLQFQELNMIWYLLSAAACGRSRKFSLVFHGSDALSTLYRNASVRSSRTRENKLVLIRAYENWCYRRSRGCAPPLRSAYTLLDNYRNDRAEDAVMIRAVKSLPKGRYTYVYKLHWLLSLECNSNPLNARRWALLHEKIPSYFNLFILTCCALGGLHEIYFLMRLQRKCVFASYNWIK